MVRFVLSAFSLVWFAGGACGIGLPRYGQLFVDHSGGSDYSAGIGSFVGIDDVHVHFAAHRSDRLHGWFAAHPSKVCRSNVMYSIACAFRFYIELSWFFSTCLGLILFLLEIGVVFFVKFGQTSYPYIAYITAAMLGMFIAFYSKAT
jgi:hypothetical protein